MLHVVEPHNEKTAFLHIYFLAKETHIFQTLCNLSRQFVSKQMSLNQDIRSRSIFRPFHSLLNVFEKNRKTPKTVSTDGISVIQTRFQCVCRATKCSPTQYAPFSSILCTLHTQYAPLEHFVYPAYTICYQRSILCRVGIYIISVVVRGYTICSS